MWCGQGPRHSDESVHLSPPREQFLSPPLPAWGAATQMRWDPPGKPGQGC